MPNEAITLFTGQAGCQIGNAIWELFCAEHGISADGKIENCTDEDRLAASAFYSESSYGTFVPRCIFSDLEDVVIGDIRLGAYRNLFHSGSLLAGIEDAANIFARGYWSMGAQHIHNYLETMRHQVENCNAVGSLLTVHSCGGGTGSGYSALQMDELSELYPKTYKVECCVFPTGLFSTNMVEPYNALLAAHSTMSSVDMSFLWDNTAMYRVCQDLLAVKNVSYSHINKLVTQVYSSMTCCSRFGGPLTGHLVHYLTNLVPYPRIHFPVTSYAPMKEQEKIIHEAVTTSSMTRQLFENSSQFSSVDVESGTYVSCCLIYRGLISPSEAYQCVQTLKSNNRVKFVDWCATGMKMTICDIPPTVISNSHMCRSDKNVSLMTNSSAISEVFEQLLKKFNHLYSKRAFVHWYVGEGMEEGEFSDAIDNINALIGDYQACCSTDGAFGTDHNLFSNSGPPKKKKDADEEESEAPAPKVEEKKSELAPAAPATEDTATEADEESRADDESRQETENGGEAAEGGEEVGEAEE